MNLINLKMERFYLLMKFIHRFFKIFLPRGIRRETKKFCQTKAAIKEFARQWLISNGFQGLEGQQLPEIDNKFTNIVSERYIELYETITGKKFIPAKTENIEFRVKIIF